MRNKKLLLVALGLGAWWLLKRRQNHEEMTEAARMATMQKGLPQPTDSMMPGSVGPAINSILKQRDGTLECLSCY